MTRRTARELPERLPPAGDVELPAPEAFHRRPLPMKLRVAFERRGGLPWLSAAALAGAAAAVVVVAVFVSRTPGEPAPGGGPEPVAAFGTGGPLRDKGPSGAPQPGPAVVSLAAVVQAGEGALPVEDGEPLEPAARMRFLYDNLDYGYLMLVSVTGDAAVSPLYPLREGPSIPAAPGLGIPLPGAVELDDHLGPERFFALFTAEPLAFEQVAAAAAAARVAAGGQDGDAWLRGLRRLPLKCAQASLLIEKRAPAEDGDG
ncbi:MAG: hypothetical protein FJ098_07020 [Deltaproteobacteria bacterium]|nr:hypothetical protein [Deltaproteobacteria bacterium]